VKTDVIPQNIFEKFPVTTMKFINPQSDFAFKKIFGSPESQDILKSLINALVYRGNPTIQMLDIINPYFPSKQPDPKDAYIDVKAKTTDGKTFIIKKQVLSVSSFDKRIIYNAAKEYSSQLSRGEGFSKLKPLIYLTISDFAIFDNHSHIISHFIYKEKDHDIDYPDPEIELVFVELPKFKKSIDELETPTDKWLYFLKNASILETVPEQIGDIWEIQDAFDIANEASLCFDDVEELEKRQMFLEDKRNAMLKGIEHGMKMKSLDIAQKLLGKLDILTISQITNLTLEEIQRLPN
jgi:predicted transposase/invertase (TIGR01784 family)